MRYPMTKNWLTFARQGDGSFRLTDHLTGDEYTCSPETAGLLRRLDGRTDPRRAAPALPPEEVRRRMAAFRRAGLLRTGRRVEGERLFTLWIPGRRLCRRVCCWLNGLLLASFLPAAVLGWHRYLHAGGPTGPDWFLPGLLLGMLSGVALHELAHACAALAFGAPVFEFGAGMMHGLPICYTLLDDSGCTPLQQAQIGAAGPEMNLLLTGVFLLLGTLPRLGGLLGTAALVNSGLALTNLLLVDGLDGLSVFSALLEGDEETLGMDGWRVLRRKRFRRALRKQGLQGYAALTAAVLLSGPQLLLAPAALILLLEGIAWLC